jgi:glycosyltransferase involved in cell wall biosynthesis
MQKLDYPLVSIITPCWNSEDYIEETIKSIINQSYKNIELIIIDGGSSDGTLNIIRKYEKSVDYWISEKDSGMYQAINKGLRRASGDIVAYLNSDDQYYNNTIKSVVQYFKDNIDVELIYGDLAFVDQNGKYLYKKRYPKFCLDRLIRSDFCMIGQPAAFWRNNLHNKIGYFDESYKLVADYDFFVRAAMYVKITHTSQVLAAFRLHSASLTLKNREIGKREIENVQDKYLKNARGIYSKSLKLLYKIQFILANISSLFLKARLKTHI